MHAIGDILEQGEFRMKPATDSSSVLEPSIRHISLREEWLPADIGALINDTSKRLRLIGITNIQLAQPEGLSHKLIIIAPASFSEYLPCIYDSFQNASTNDFYREHVEPGCCPFYGTLTKRENRLVLEIATIHLKTEIDVITSRIEGERAKLKKANELTFEMCRNLARIRYWVTSHRESLSVEGIKQKSLRKIAIELKTLSRDIDRAIEIKPPSYASFYEVLMNTGGFVARDAGSPLRGGSPVRPSAGRGRASDRPSLSPGKSGRRSSGIGGMSRRLNGVVLEPGRAHFDVRKTTSAQL